MPGHLERGAPSAIRMSSLVYWLSWENSARKDADGNAM
jgi:hypothetical protein